MIKIDKKIAIKKSKKILKKLEKTLSKNIIFRGINKLTLKNTKNYKNCLINRSTFISL